MVRIGDAFLLVGGGTPSTAIESYWGAGTPWFSSADIDSSGKITFRRRVTDDGINNSTTNIVSKNTVVVVTRVGLGKVAKLKEDMCFSQDIQALIPKNGIEIDADYLCYQMRFHMQSMKYKGQGTTISGITKKQLSDVEILLPNCTEQRRTVAHIEELFSELDNGVETLRKTKRQLAVYRQAVLKTAFRECASKENVQFGDILSEKPRNGYSPKGVDYQTKYRNLTLTATTSGYFRDNCFKYIDIDIDDDSYLWVKYNDILIQRANTIEYVGTAALYQGEDNRYVYPDLMMKCHTKDGINPQFVVYQLQSRVCKSHFREHATGTSGSMPKINQQTVMTAPIVMTSLDEQERIVKQIGERLSVCDSIEKTVETALQQAEAIRQSILKQAFEGRL